MKPSEYIDRILLEAKASGNIFQQQIKNGKFAPITSSIWKTVLDEGLDEEWNVGKKDLEYMILAIPKEDKEGLKNFNDSIIEKYNSFDIWLKNNFKYYVDFIDYDNGEIKIVRKNKQEA